jgi:hypothetical protein
MKRLIVLVSVFVVALAMMMTSAGAVPPAQQKLKLFEGDKGSASWQGPAKDDQGSFFDDSPLDTNHARIKFNVPSQSINPPYSYAGAYALGTQLGGQKLANVRNLSFDFMDPSQNDITLGAPRLSVPIDEDGDGVFEHDPFDPTSEQYAFLAAGHCLGQTLNATWDRADFTGRTTTGCAMQYKGVDYASSGSASAWHAFVVAAATLYPSAKIARQSDALAIAVQDEVGTSFIDRVAFQNHMFGGGPNSITNCPNEASC